MNLPIRRHIGIGVRGELVLFNRFGKLAALEQGIAFGFEGFRFGVGHDVLLLTE